MYVIRKVGQRNIDRIQHDMEDVFHALTVEGRPMRVRVSRGNTYSAWRPPIEVYETQDALHVLAEIGGLTEDDIEVVLDDSVMTIRGERRPVAVDGFRKVHAMGILYGRFAAEIYIPVSVDAEKVEAAYDQGILHVRMPRAAETRIAINSERTK